MSTWRYMRSFPKCEKFPKIIIPSVRPEQVFCVSAEPEQFRRKKPNRNGVPAGTLYSLDKAVQCQKFEYFNKFFINYSTYLVLNKVRPLRH